MCQIGGLLCLNSPPSVGLYLTQNQLQQCFYSCCYMLCRKEDGVLRVMEIDQAKINAFLKIYMALISTCISTSYFNI